MHNHAVEIISPQKLEYEMERVDLPDDYNFFEIGYCGHPSFPYAHIQLEQATKLIISYLQGDTIHFFMIPSTTKRHNWFVCLFLQT